MDDTISRQAAIDCISYDEEYTEDCIRALPFVQPKRKTGYWIKVAGMNERCSSCNHYFPLSYFIGRPFEINFCPNCGADMRGDAND